MSKIVTKGLTFDDVLIVPKYSDFKRSEVILSSKLHDRLQLNFPVISSPMDTVTETDMAIAMSLIGGLGIIHRNLSIAEQTAMVKFIKSFHSSKITSVSTVDQNNKLFVAAAVGAGSDLEQRMQSLSAAKVDLVCVDSGHGHSKYIIDAIKFIKKQYPDIILMGGNVATYDGAKALIDAGVDILRVGMGPGSICTTRIISGMGVPQLTAIEEVVKAAKDTKVTLIADGGIKQLGDIAKAIGMGAHAVMLGSLLAGHDEAPGNIIEIDGNKFKSYRGMGSLGAMTKGGAERYGQDPKELKKKLITEGVEGVVKYKGNIEDYLFQIAGSLKSSFYYVGARNMQEFHNKVEFIQITSASIKESDTHSIKVVNVGNNYNY
jgi:IMP dehydrogenase